MIELPMPGSPVGTRVPPGSPRAELTEEERLNLERAVALHHASFEDRPSFHNPDGEPPHRRGIHWLAERARQQGKQWRYSPDALTDRTDEIIDVIAKGDRVWMMFRVTGTHSGELWGYPPTGRRITFLEFGLHRFEGGKISEAWFLGDELELLEQLEGNAG